MTRGPLVRPAPRPRAILWVPESAGPTARPAGYHVFVEQSALSALQDHFAASPKQGVLGFLVGDLCRDPQSSLSYVVVDSTIRLNQAIFGDKTGVVVGKLWDRIQAEIAKIEGHLIGWYHSHPPHGVGLSPGDVETHVMYFTQPWQIALVLAAEARGATAGFFRPGREPGSVTAELSFYELMPAGSSEAKQSVLPWVNYRTDADVAKASAPRAPSPSADPRSTLQVVGSHAGKAATPPPPPKLRLPKFTPKPPSKPEPEPPPSDLDATQPPKLRLPKFTPKPPSKPEPQRSPEPSPKPLDPSDLHDLLGTALPPPKRPPLPPARRTSGAVLRPPAPSSSPPTLEIERASEPPAPPIEPSAAEPPSPPPPPPPPPRKSTSARAPAGPASPAPPPPTAIADLPLLHVEEPEAAAPPPPPSPPRAARPAPPPAEPEAFELDQFPAPRAAAARHPGPPWSGRPASAIAEAAVRSRALRIAAFALGVGALGAGVWFSGLLRRSPGPAPPATRTAPPPAVAPAVDPRLAALDRLGDTLSQAVRTYVDRALLFDRRQMTCADLARGLVAVEQRWISYNADGTARAPPLDVQRTRRDDALYTAVDSVDRHFERSGCARP